MSKTRTRLRWKVVQSSYTDSLDRPMWYVQDTYRQQPFTDGTDRAVLLFEHTYAKRKAAALNRIEKASRR